MITPSLALFALALLPLPQDAEAPADEADQAFVELRDEFDAAMDAFWKEYGEQPAEERGAFHAEHRPDAEAYVPRFFEIAQAHPGTKGAAGAYAWIVNHSSQGDALGRAIEVLIEDHADGAELGTVCTTLEYRMADGASYLERILEGSTNESVRGSACFALARNVKSQASTARRVQALPEEEVEEWRGYLGDAFERLRKADPSHLEEEAIELFERVCVEFPEVEHRSGSLGEAAKGNLFELRNLAIGKVAPDIQGEDIEGTPFRLSDYRGKIVMLDFWGHW